MSQSRNKAERLQPYQRIENLDGYIRRSIALTRLSGSIGKGKDHLFVLDGREMTMEEFNYLFPDKDLKYRSTQLDGRHLEK